MVDDTEELLRELEVLWEQGGNSRGIPWTRDELHQRKDVHECVEIKIETESPAEDIAQK
jgi:hypothetical protein